MKTRKGDRSSAHGIHVYTLFARAAVYNRVFHRDAPTLRQRPRAPREIVVVVVVCVVVAVVSAAGHGLLGIRKTILIKDYTVVAAVIHQSGQLTLILYVRTYTCMHALADPTVADPAVRERAPGRRVCACKNRLSSGRIFFAIPSRAHCDTLSAQGPRPGDERTDPAKAPTRTHKRTRTISGWKRRGRFYFAPV